CKAAPVDDGSGIFPLFERLLREELDGKEGSAIDMTQLPPVNFDLLPSKVTSMPEALAALKIADQLLAQLDNLSSSLRFAHFLKIALVQHTFTRLLPVPLGPVSLARVGTKDDVWGTAATPEQQVDTALVVKRIAQHFSMSCGATFGHRGFDGTRVIILGAMVTLLDRLLRQPGSSTPSKAMMGRLDDEKEQETRFLVSWEVFAKQSETFLLFSPDLNVTRARSLAYFQEVEQEAQEQGAKMKHLFQWEKDGWVMEFPDQGAEALAGKMAKSLYRRRITLIDSYLDSYFPEFAAYRDVCMWWKYYLCTDPVVFRFQPLEFSDGHLQWVIDVHPRWQPPSRSKCLANRCGLGQADSELLLSYLTVPSPTEFMPFRSKGYEICSRLARSPEATVDAVIELLDQALKLDTQAGWGDLRAACVLGTDPATAAGRLAEAAQLPAICGRESRGTCKIQTAGKVNDRSALTILGRWLDSVRTDFGQQFAEEQTPDILVSGAGEDAGNSCCVYEASGHHSSLPKIWKAIRGKAPLPKVESVVDRETHLACQLHGHRVLLLRNLRAEELTMDLVERLLCSFVFLTSRHTWNEDTLGMPEPELFEVIFAKRLELIGWLEEAPYADACRVLDAVLKTATGIEKGPPGWAIWPEAANRGRYMALGHPQASTDGRLPMAGSFGDTVPAAEVNLQSLAFRVEGQQMQALDERAAQDPDVLHVFGSSAKTMQCVSLGDFEHRQDRKVVGTDYVISMWDKETGGLPEIGLCDRLYDPDDLATEEQWIADFFEPIRKKYFVKLGFPPADVQFYLPENTVPEDSHVVILAGGHPKKSSTIWKEVVIYKDFGCCHVFAIEACGRRKYRVLEMSTDARFCHWEMQPESSMVNYGDQMQVDKRPRDPWPASLRQDLGS
ncbi:unnamed protein product, partial [Symbiodinium necroappetens]